MGRVAPCRETLVTTGLVMLAGDHNLRCLDYSDLSRVASSVKSATTRATMFDAETGALFSSTTVPGHRDGRVPEGAGDHGLSSASCDMKPMN